MAIRILDRYVGWTFLGSYLVCLTFFVGLFLIVDFFGHLDDFLDAREHLIYTHYTLSSLIVRYYLLSLGTTFGQVAPFVTLMGAMFSVTRLSRNNELMPMVASGVSLYRILAPLFLFALLLTVGLIVLQQFGMPTIVHEKEAIEDVLNGRDPRYLRFVKLSDGLGNRIDAGRYDPVGKKIVNLDFTSLESPVREVKADTAQWRDDATPPGWYLTGGVELRAGEDGNLRERIVHYLDGTDLVPEDLEFAKVRDAAGLSFSKINEIFHRHPERKELKVLLHYQITFPLSNMVLLLLGLPLVVNRRVRSPFLSVGMCLFVCAAFFAATFIAHDIGRRGFLPVTMAWLPVVVFGSVGICMFDGIRT